MRSVLTTLRRMVVLSWTTDPRRLVISGVLLLGSAACPPLVAVFARALIDSAGSPGVTVALFAALFVAALVGQLMLGHFAHLWYFELGELNEVVLNRALLRTIANRGDLDHVESAAVADAVELSREDIAKMRATVEACLILGVTVLQVVFGAVLMFGVAPYLVLLPLAAAVPVLTGARAERAIQDARGRAVRRSGGCVMSALSQPRPPRRRSSASETPRPTCSRSTRRHRPASSAKSATASAAIFCTGSSGRSPSPPSTSPPSAWSSRPPRPGMRLRATSCSW